MKLKKGDKVLVCATIVDSTQESIHDFYKVKLGYQGKAVWVVDVDVKKFEVKENE